MASKKVILNLKLQKGSFVNVKVASEGESALELDEGEMGEESSRERSRKKNRVEKEKLAARTCLEMSIRSLFINYAKTSPLGASSQHHQT